MGYLPFRQAASMICARASFTDSHRDETFRHQTTGCHNSHAIHSCKLPLLINSDKQNLCTSQTSLKAMLQNAASCTPQHVHTNTHLVWAIAAAL
jgi:hypothetical protein